VHGAGGKIRKRRQAPSASPDLCETIPGCCFLTHSNAAAIYAFFARLYAFSPAAIASCT
jgi:hypothetical protein